MLIFRISQQDILQDIFTGYLIRICIDIKDILTRYPIGYMIKCRISLEDIRCKSRIR